MIQSTLTDLPARRELDRYVKLLKLTPEYLQADEYSPAKADHELQKWLNASKFNYNQWGLDFPDAAPSGERVSGSISSTPDPDGGASFKRFNYSFVMYRKAAGNGRMTVEFSLYVGTHSGYLWMGECNNSAALTINDPYEAWAIWQARRAIEEF